MRLISMNRIALYAAFVISPAASCSLCAILRTAQYGDDLQRHLHAQGPGARVPSSSSKIWSARLRPRLSHHPRRRRAYKIPLLHHDFPLKMHIWSLDAAITARYMQDKISPRAAEDYRRAVFASQNSIASKEDLKTSRSSTSARMATRCPLSSTPPASLPARSRRTTRWRARRPDPDPHHLRRHAEDWIQVTDVSQLYQAIDTAIAQTASQPAAPAKTHRTTTKRK